MVEGIFAQPSKRLKILRKCLSEKFSFANLIIHLRKNSINVVPPRDPKARGNILGFACARLQEMVIPGCQWLNHCNLVFDEIGTGD